MTTIKRKCKICNHIEEYESGSEGSFNEFMYKVVFRKQIEILKAESPNILETYHELKAGHYNGSFLCFNCVSELFHECPEVIKEIRMVIPNV